MVSSFRNLAILIAISALGSLATLAQTSSGKLTGKVTDADGKPVAGVTIIITNQTNSDVASKRTSSDGSYSANLRGGAYRIAVAAPYEARFDRAKSADYGVFSNFLCDETKRKCSTLENVIIGGGDRKIDFVVVQPSAEKPAPGPPPSPEPVAETREVRDRWRIAYPEYDRYGDVEHADATSRSSEVLGTTRTIRMF